MVINTEIVYLYASKNVLKRKSIINKIFFILKEKAKLLLVFGV